VAHLDEMTQRLPVRTRARVVSVARDAATGDYVVSIDGGEMIRARSVVVVKGASRTLSAIRLRVADWTVIRRGSERRSAYQLLELSEKGVVNL
jgi:hypothetical protein